MEEAQQLQRDPREMDHPLKGQHYAPLKAPSASGMRTEHIGEILGIPRRRIANKVLRALGAVINMIEQGQVPEAGRWITYSRTIMIRKKSGKTPRTIKVSEFYRTMGAKRALQKGGVNLRKTLMAAHQYGVGVPGGAEALTHFSTTVEDTIKKGEAPPMVVADLDQQNFFNLVEWRTIRECAKTMLPEASNILEWEQQCPAKSFTSTLEEYEYDRGAEQG